MAPHLQCLDVVRHRRLLSMASHAKHCGLDQTIDDMSTVEAGRRAVSADFAATDMLGELASVVQHSGLMIPELAADSKIPAIKELVDRLHEHDVVDDNLAFLQAVLERETLRSTVIGDGEVALPHARGRMVRGLGMAMGRSRIPIGFPSGDDRHEVGLICLIAIPANEPGLYLKLLSALARVFQDAAFRVELGKAESAERMQQLLARKMELTSSIPPYPFRS
jgi:mannitol/fructose-specific phosphotransferase system IIA component (Ntr-type)